LKRRCGDRGQQFDDMGAAFDAANLFQGTLAPAGPDPQSDQALEIRCDIAADGERAVIGRSLDMFDLE
jgi:hypothetical protein